MDSPAIHQSRNYFKIPRGVQTELEQGTGGGSGGEGETFPFMLPTSQPRSPFWVSNQGMKSGKDSRIPGPVGALIKLPGFHSRTHMVSETVLASSASAGSFVLKGRELFSTHASSYHCAEAAASASAGQYSPPARAS